MQDELDKIYKYYYKCAEKSFNAYRPIISVHQFTYTKEQIINRPNNLPLFESIDYKIDKHIYDLQDEIISINNSYIDDVLNVITNQYKYEFPLSIDKRYRLSDFVTGLIKNGYYLLYPLEDIIKNYSHFSNNDVVHYNKELGYIKLYNSIIKETSSYYYGNGFIKYHSTSIELCNVNAFYSYKMNAYQYTTILLQKCLMLINYCNTDKHDTTEQDKKYLIFLLATPSCKFRYKYKSDTIDFIEHYKSGRIKIKLNNKNGLVYKNKITDYLNTIMI